MIHEVTVRVKGQVYRVILNYPTWGRSLVSSRTTPGGWHRVEWAGDAWWVCDCDCDAWRWRQRCSHTEAVRLAEQPSNWLPTVPVLAVAGGAG